MRAPPTPPRRLARRLAWLGLYWLAGVAAMSAVAFGLRALMQAAGLAA